MLVFLLYFIFLLSYDVTIDQIIDYQRIPIEYVEKMEIGNETFLFKSTSFDVLRIYYRIGEESGYFHSFKSSCFRFFNNLVITMKSVEEESGIWTMKSILMVILLNLFLRILKRNSTDDKIHGFTF
jgi:hypothetical protein